MPTSPLDFAGCLSIPTGNHYIRTPALATGASADYTLTGDLSGKTSACLGLRMKYADLTLATQGVAGLRRSTGSAVAAPIMLRSFNGSMYVYATGVAGAGSFANTFWNTLDNDLNDNDEFVVFGLANSAGFNTTNFPQITGTKTMAIYSWDATNGLVLRNSNNHANFTASDTFGSDRTGFTDSYRWTIGDNAGTSAPFKCGDMFVLDDLTNITEAHLTAIAEGSRSPSGFTECLHYWPLDNTSGSVLGTEDCCRDVMYEVENNATSFGVSAFDTITGSPTWANDLLGPAHTSSIDPFLADPDTTLWYGNTKALARAYNGGNCDFLDCGDSFAFPYKGRSVASGIAGAGLPIVGYTSGCGSLANVGSLGSINANLTEHVWSNASSLDVTLVNGGTSVFRHLPVGHGGSELHNNSGSALPALSDLAVLTVQGQPFSTDGHTREINMLSSGDTFGLRTLAYKDGTETADNEWFFNGAAGTFIMNGVCALPEWPTNPWSGSFRTPSNDTFFWCGPQGHGFSADASGETSITIRGTINGMPNGEHVRFLANSVHKLSGGQPASGLHYISCCRESANDSNLITNTEATAASGTSAKNFTNDNLEAYLHGARWRADAPIVVFYNIADSNTASIGGWLTRMRTVLSNVGYTRVHFVLISQFLNDVSSPSNTVIESREERANRQNGYKTLVDANPDVTMLNLFNWMGSAAPVGPDAINDCYYAWSGSTVFDGYPTRERRAFDAAMAAAGVTLLDGTVSLLDNGNLHWNNTGGADVATEDVVEVMGGAFSLLPYLSDGLGNGGVGALIAMGVL